MPNYLSNVAVDVTFNAWWNKLGRRREQIGAALERTIIQINGTNVRRATGPFPPNYVPPPCRSASASNNNTLDGMKVVLENAKRSDFGKFFTYASIGISLVRADLGNLEQKFRVRTVLMDIRKTTGQNYIGRALPPNVKQKLLLVACFVDSADRIRRQTAILEQHEDEIQEFNTRGPAAENMSDTPFITYEDYVKRQKMYLEQLQWMGKNTIGAGVYGYQRSNYFFGEKRGHDEAMEMAATAQLAFNSLSAVAPRRQGSAPTSGALKATENRPVDLPRINRPVDSAVHWPGPAPLSGVTYPGQP